MSLCWKKIKGMFAEERDLPDFAIKSGSAVRWQLDVQDKHIQNQWSNNG